MVTLINNNGSIISRSSKLDGKCKEKGAKWVVSVCDVFDHEDFPVYCMSDEELEETKVRCNNREVMLSINEVIEINENTIVSKGLLS